MSVKYLQQIIRKRGQRLEPQLIETIKDKHTKGETAKSIAIALGISTRTVNKYTIQTTPPRLGRPIGTTTLATDEVVRFIHKQVVLHPDLSSGEIGNRIHSHYNKTISARQVRSIRREKLGMRRKRLSMVAYRRASSKVQAQRDYFASSVVRFNMNNLH